MYVYITQKKRFFRLISGWSVFGWLVLQESVKWLNKNIQCLSHGVIPKGLKIKNDPAF